MQNMDQFKINIENWSRAFPTVVGKVYKRFGPIMISNVRVGSLSGQVLNRKTGNLQKSIKTIFKEDKDVHMFLGTDVQSVKGFGYGAYWMQKGRDFLNPAINKSMPKVHNAIASDLEKEFAKVVR